MEIRNKIAAEFDDDVDEGNGEGSRLSGRKSRIREEMQRAGVVEGGVEGDKENSHEQRAKKQTYQQHRQQQKHQTQHRMQQQQMQKQMEMQMRMQGQMDALRGQAEGGGGAEDAELSDAAIVGQLAEENDKLRAQCARAELRAEEMRSSQKLKESVLQNQMAEFWTQLQQAQGALEKENARFGRLQKKLRQMQGLDLITLSASKLEDLGEQLEKAQVHHTLSLLVHSSHALLSYTLSYTPLIRSIECRRTSSGENERTYERRPHRTSTSAR
jgi:hypothetical protein